MTRNPKMVAQVEWKLDQRERGHCPFQAHTDLSNLDTCTKLPGWVERIIEHKRAKESP